MAQRCLREQVKSVAKNRLKRVSISSGRWCEEALWEVWQLGSARRVWFACARPHEWAEQPSQPYFCQSGPASECQDPGRLGEAAACCLTRLTHIYDEASYPQKVPASPSQLADAVAIKSIYIMPTLGFSAADGLHKSLIRIRRRS